ncbi:Crystallin, lambda 1 [Branchiostoma belcheri]|nr:Crystallin, lambda 1 [Branchiostoma belcheri]
MTKSLVEKRTSPVIATHYTETWQKFLREKRAWTPSQVLTDPLTFHDTDDPSDEATAEHDMESLESSLDDEVSEEDESELDSQKVESGTETDSDQSDSESDVSSDVSSSTASSEEESEEYSFDSEKWTVYRDSTIPLTHDPGECPSTHDQGDKTRWSLLAYLRLTVINRAQQKLGVRALMKKYGYLVLK